MRRDLLPYYVTRALLSAGFAGLIGGLTWKAALAAVAMFAGFVIYASSGWFVVDPRRPLLPLRRDERGRQIQHRALQLAVTAGCVGFVVLEAAAPLAWTAGRIALSLAIVTYFVTQFTLLARA